VDYDDEGHEQYRVDIHDCYHRRALYLFASIATMCNLHSFPTRRSSDLQARARGGPQRIAGIAVAQIFLVASDDLFPQGKRFSPRSEEHTSELQSLRHLVCRLLLEKKK